MFCLERVESSSGAKVLPQELYCSQGSEMEHKQLKFDRRGLLQVVDLEYSGASFLQLDGTSVSEM